MAKTKRQIENELRHRCVNCGRTATVEYCGEPYCPYCRNDIERENAYEILASIGVPFDSDGEPVGIWSD